MHQRSPCAISLVGSLQDVGCDATGQRASTAASDRYRYVSHSVVRLILILTLALVSPAISVAQQLTIGSTTVRLGQPETVLKNLTKEFNTQRSREGWSIQPRERSRTAPDIGIQMADGRVSGISIIWGPGFTPPANEIVSELEEALPQGARCDVQSVKRLQEGEIVRTLEWRCGGYRVLLVSGESSGGNSVSIAIQTLSAKR